MVSKLQWSLFTVAIAAVMLITAGTSRVASATGVTGTFASFSTQSGGFFDFFKSSGTGTLDSAVNNTNVETAIPVSFDFTGTNTYGVSGPIDAYLTFSSTTSGGAASGLGLVAQPMGLTTYTFTDTNGNTLLTVTSSSSTIFGLQGGRNATLADTSGSGDTITYTSNYLTFGKGQDSYSTTLSGLTNPLGVGTGGLLNPFHASGAGSFSASPVPEAGTLVSFALLSLCGGLVLIRQRKRSAARRS